MTHPPEALTHPRGSWRDGWYVAPHHVVFRDLDAFGHVNNAVFFRRKIAECSQDAFGQRDVG